MNDAVGKQHRFNGTVEQRVDLDHLHSHNIVLHRDAPQQREDFTRRQTTSMPTGLRVAPFSKVSRQVHNLGYELQKIFCISRATVRRIMEILVNEGHLENQKNSTAPTE